MSQAFRGQQQTMNLNDEPYEAAAEHPPALKASIGLIEILWGATTNVIQVATSTIGWLSLMILGVGSTFVGFGDLLHTYGWKVLVALSLAIGTQVFLHMNAQPITSAWHRMRHIQHTGVKSTHALSDVMGQLSMRTSLCYVGLGSEIISDGSFIYAILGSLGNPWIMVLIIVAWMITLTGSSTICLYDGATRIWGAIEDLKDYRAYHEKNDRPKAAPKESRS